MVRIASKRSSFPFWMNDFRDWTDEDGGATVMSARYAIQNEIGKGQWKYWPELKYSIRWWNSYGKDEVLTEKIIDLLRENKWEQ